MTYIVRGGRDVGAAATAAGLPGNDDFNAADQDLFSPPRPGVLDHCGQIHIPLMNQPLPA
jgi:hypothetical protein